jgi:hypothetical protein
MRTFAGGGRKFGKFANIPSPAPYAGAVAALRWFDERLAAGIPLN